MTNLKLKNVLTESELDSVSSMSNYWEEVRRRENTEPLQHEWRQVAELLNVKLLSVLRNYLLLKERYDAESSCPCLSCEYFSHSSDCAVHNAPALLIGECDCVSKIGI